MPQESPELRAAREHLAKGEAAYRSVDGLFHLEEGLALIDEAAAAGQELVARNLATTYAARIYGNIRTLIASRRGIPEPELEHFFKVIVAFDAGDFELPTDAREIKIAIARRLIDRYYEGHTAQQKEQALQELARIDKEASKGRTG